MLGEVERAMSWGGDSAIVLVSEDGPSEDGGAGEWIVGMSSASRIGAALISEVVLEVPSGKPGGKVNGWIEKLGGIVSVRLNSEGGDSRVE